MGKALKILLICLGFWVGLEMYLEGPRDAFGGLFDLSSRELPSPLTTRSAPARAGEAVQNAQNLDAERRERLLAD